METFIDKKFYIPNIIEFHVGFEYEYKEGFTDGTVKSQEQFNNSKWIQAIFSIGDRPYIDRALNGRNAENNICGIRAKSLN